MKVDRHSLASDVRRIRRHLRDHGSAEHAAGVRWFFKEDVESHGWYTGDLRKYARELHKASSYDAATLVEVTEMLFDSRVLEEKLLAVLLVQRSLRTLPAGAFDRLERWLDRVESWADHDALTMFVLGPLLVESPAHVRTVVAWAKATSRWRRRAAAVTLIHGIQRGRFVREATLVARLLRRDQDDMVQKGLGWLLRVWCKVRPDEAIPVVLGIRTDTARLVVRTACETLSPARRRLVMGK
jgi:3-methyladenine DNA glycosylase AlkD